MTHLRHLYVSSANWHGAIAVFACALLLLSLPTDATSSEGMVPQASPPALGTNVAYPTQMLAKHGKGLDRGTFEILQMSALPTAWVYVEDGTIDGVGVEYWAIHSTFVSPGPQHPSVDLSYEYQAGVNHTTLADFVNWIVADNPHVSGPGDIQVYRVDAGPAGS